MFLFIFCHFHWFLLVATECLEEVVLDITIEVAGVVTMVVILVDMVDAVRATIIVATTTGMLFSLNDIICSVFKLFLCLSFSLLNE